MSDALTIEIILLAIEIAWLAVIIVQVRRELRKLRERNEAE